MSDLTIETGFVPRGDELAQARAAIAEVRGLERERRLRHLVTVAGGWLMAGLMSVVAVASLAVVLHRPVPRDRIAIALLHDDGTYDAPVVREDLPQSRTAILFRHSVVQYVMNRENYTWEGVNNEYKTVTAMSSPAERERYKHVMFDRHNPSNPAVAFGEGTNAGKADVAAIRITTVPASPHEVAATFLLKVTMPGQPVKVVRKTARMTWIAADSEIPPEIQQLYDPMGIAFTYYESIVDPDSGK